MKPRHVLLAVALAGAAALAVFGDRSPASDVAEAVDRPAAPAGARAPEPAPARPAPAATLPVRATAAPILTLVARDVLIGDGKDGQGDPFGRHDWTPPPPPPQPAAPPPPPSAPPLPFTVIGKAVADGTWEVYLIRGERTYVVRDKDVIDGTYRVDAIAPPVLTLTYLPLKQAQQLNIGVFD